MSTAVVIPCFNYGRYLAEAVESVVEQTLRPDEVVIVDDGSTDDTCAVAQRLIAAHADLPMRLISTEHSGSAGATRNVGVAATAAEYVLCLDADDRLDPSFLETCVAALDRHPEAAIAYGDILGFANDGVVQRLAEWDTQRELHVNLVGSASLFRRAAWEQVGGYDPLVGHSDWDFWIGCIEQGWVGVRASGALWHYRVHDGLYSRLIDSDQEIRARIVRKHASLYSEPQRRWASGVLAGEPRALAVATELGVIPDAKTAERALSDAGAGRAVARETPEREVSARHTRDRPARLCVGMSTYDDFDGVWFTIQAIRMYQRDVLDDLSLIVIDNDPQGAAAQPLRELGSWILDYRYIPFGGYNGTAVRDLVFREADADIVCCVDSHVLLVPGALAALLAWFAEHPESADLLQGPLIRDDLGIAATHLEPTWGEGMFGQWGVDPRIEQPACAPFEVPMQGLGVFACRREAWPGLNPRMRGFGGEEGYLHEKFRQRGGRTICHPALGWLHRFGRPRGVAYTNRWEDRVRNYYLGWSEIGWDPGPMETHFRELLGATAAGTLLEQARLEVEHPLNVFDAVLCIAENAGEHTHPSELAWRIEHVEDEEDGEPGLRRLGCWQAALRAALQRGYENVLVTTDTTGPQLDPAAVGPAELADEWDICVLSDSGRVEPFQAEAAAEDRPELSVAVHRRAYARILAAIPAEQEGRVAFLARHGSLEGYLLGALAGGSFGALPLRRLDPATDRPRVVEALVVSELDEGLRVSRPDSTSEHQLNNTAAIVLELCDGSRSVVEIAEAVAELFDLAAVPLGEVSACVQWLRRLRLISAPDVTGGLARRAGRGGET
jgi:cellulose synthase/poly-beta-1,6-N-acetylglucosamine synthase-like glycosyltransferase